MFVDARESEASAILGAMWAVTRAGRGEADASGRGRALVARDLRRTAARLVGTASLVDGELDPARLDLAVAYARALGVDEDCVRQLVETARGNLEWVKADMQRRNAATFPGLALDASGRPVAGELLVSTFTGAMHPAGGLGGHILPVIYEWHVGVAVSPVVPPAHATLEATSFWTAWDRGRATTRDVPDPAWDFWSLAPRPLDAVRALHGIAPLPHAAGAA